MCSVLVHEFQVNEDDEAHRQRELVLPGSPRSRRGIVITDTTGIVVRQGKIRACAFLYRPWPPHFYVTALSSLGV